MLTAQSSVAPAHLSCLNQSPLTKPRDSAWKSTSLVSCPVNHTVHPIEVRVPHHENRIFFMFFEICLSTIFFSRSVLLCDHLSSFSSVTPFFFIFPCKSLLPSLSSLHSAVCPVGWVELGWVEEALSEETSWSLCSCFYWAQERRCSLPASFLSVALCLNHCLCPVHLSSLSVSHGLSHCLSAP